MKNPARPTRQRKKILLLCILSIIGMASYYLLPKSPTVDLAVEDKAPLLLSSDDVSQSRRATFNTQIAISGSLYPVEQTTLIAKVGGDVQKVLVKEGAYVKKGQVLAQLDTSDLTQVFNEKYANLLAKQAASDLSVSSSKRYQKLIKQQYFSEHDYETAINQEKIDKANVKLATAELTAARLQRDYATIMSSIAGFVSQRTIDPGVNVKVGQTLFKVVNLDKLELRALIPANEIAAVKIGQTVSIKVDGLRQDFSGTLVRINPSVTPGTRAFTAYIDIDNSQHKLRDGMFAIGDLVIKSHIDTIIVPFDAVRKDGKSEYIYRIKDNAIERVDVISGLSDPSRDIIEITQGLDQQDWVIASTVDIRAGETVILPNNSNKG